MGYTVWHFVVDEAEGDLKRIPAVRWSAFRNGEIYMLEWAGTELRAIELMLEVNRRRVQRVLRALAHRVIVRSGTRPLRSSEASEFLLKGEASGSSCVSLGPWVETRVHLHGML